MNFVDVFTIFPASEHATDFYCVFDPYNISIWFFAAEFNKINHQ